MRFKESTPAFRQFGVHGLSPGVTIAQDLRVGKRWSDGSLPRSGFVQSSASVDGHHKPRNFAAPPADYLRRVGEVEFALGNE